MFRALFCYVTVIFTTISQVLAEDDPSYVKVLDLFMEKPLIEFSESLSQDEVKAYSMAYAALGGQNMPDEQFAEEVGKYSKSAQQKIENLHKSYNVMTADLDIKTQEALETLQDFGANAEPSENDVCAWIMKTSEKIRALNSNEQAQIVKDMPNLGRIMTQTNFLRVQNCADVNSLIRDMLAKF